MAADASLSTRWRPAWTRWDTRQLVRAGLAAAVTLGLAWLVTAATDEGGVPWAERAGRTLPLTPVCAAVGAWVALAPALSRGETVALAALGRSRAEIAAAAVAGGALVAVAAALALGLWRGVDVAGFFPTARHATAWAWNGAAFVDPVQGLRIGADGAPLHVAADAAAGSGLTGVPPGGRAAAGALTAIAGLALPLLLGHALLDRARVWPVVLGAAVAVAASVLLFQAAAAGHVPAALGTLPTLALLVFAVRRYRGRAA
jgi:hypothetical protein